MTDTDSKGTQVLACVPGAIDVNERERHFASLRQLFGERALERRDVDDGREYRFDAADFEELSTFVANERKCCPFLTFEIRVSPDSGPIWLRLTGPEGTRSFLDAEFA